MPQRKQGFKLLAAKNHSQIFYKIMERNANSVGAIDVVGPMIKNISQWLHAIYQGRHITTE